MERGNNGQVSTRPSNYPIMEWAKGQQLVAMSFRNTGKHSPKRPQKTGLELGESRVNVNEIGSGQGPLTQRAIEGEKERLLRLSDCTCGC